MSGQQRASSKSIGNYILGRTIGEGTFGKVKLGRHILSGASVAVKVLQKDRIVEVADVERVAREVHILKLIRHAHIVQLFEIIETRGQLYLIMEYASGGELFDYIVANGRVQEPEACRFFHQIVAGVESIHEMRVVHRDLKPENLLLDDHKSIKIVDFGLSNLFRDGQRLSTACGSPCYAPPEMVAGKQYVPQMCDLWSCGVILFALVCGFLPFEDPNTANLYKKILAADFTMPNFISDNVKDLINGLLTVDPTKRFDVKAVRSHVWYRQLPESSAPPLEKNGGGASVDEDVLHELEAYGFPRDYAVRCLELNKHNHITTTYWLLLERKRKVLEQLELVSPNGIGGPKVLPPSTTAPPPGPMKPIEDNAAANAGSVVVPRGGHTPRPDYGRSAQGQRVSAGAAGSRPNTSPNRRDGYSARKAATPDVNFSIPVTTVTGSALRNSSPWRVQNSATPGAYGSWNRNGNNGHASENNGGASTPGANNPWRPQLSARGKSPSGSGGTDVLSNTAPGGTSWRAAMNGNGGGSARVKDRHAGSGNSVGIATGDAEHHANGQIAGTNSHWRSSLGGQLGQNGATPQATPRACTTPRTAFTPRAGSISATPRMGTPLGGGSYRSSQVQSPSLPVGMPGRPSWSNRRRPPNAASVTSNGVQSSTPVRSVGTPTSRMIWR